MKKFAKFSANALGTAVALATTASAAFADTAPVIEPAGGTDILQIITTITNWLFGLAGALAVVFLVYAGIQYIVGGAEGSKTAKTMIINVVIGIAVIVLSYVIVKAVIGIFG